MATIHDRRVLAVGVDRARERGLTDRLPLIGWLFAAGAVASIVDAVWPLLQRRSTELIPAGLDYGSVVRDLAPAAAIALPAAALLGYRSIRRDNRWLWRSVVLLALAAIAGAARGPILEWLFEGLDDPSVIFRPTTMPGFIYRSTTLAFATLGLAAVGALSLGLRDAGARPRRRWLVAGAIAGALLTPVAIAVAPYLQIFELPTRLNGFVRMAFNGVAYLVSISTSALWVVVAIRLFAGWRERLVPQRAWLVGTVFGLLAVLGPTLTTVLLLMQGLFVESSVPTLVFGAYSLRWIALAAALVLGLGRGPRRRSRSYAVWA